MTRTDHLIKQAQTMPKKAGRQEYIKHLEGKTLTRRQAIRAKCFECVGGNDSRPCTIPTCPLMAFSQWNSKDEGKDEGEDI
ncbi:hypothetical protein [Pelotalea chapellei]|uniref:Uncharacterized protein n=1 Tax=Pelotalea chapellei TaxID=44671 RepID=A0ABS5U5P5_9BACT|nr:hypothetical protein [Pelotalea chapellei]MBT1070993.1 hypothetical protein [Pelotalea chapellei]